MKLLALLLIVAVATACTSKPHEAEPAPSPAPIEVAPAPPAPAPTTTPPPTTTGVPACDDYLRKFDALIACDKIPADRKAASKLGLTQMKQGWAALADPNVPADARANAAESCTHALAALGRTATAMGCPI